MRKLLFLLFFYMLSSVASAQGIPTVTGGVGVESADEIKPQQANFNLKFVFTLMEGDYVADVAVKIADAGGKIVLEQMVEGPILMARLPAGNYVATVTYEGATQTRKIALHDKGMRTEQMRWKRSAADGPPML